MIRKSQETTWGEVCRKGQRVKWSVKPDERKWVEKVADEAE